MNLPVVITSRPSPPPCPECGKLMVYIRGQHRYQCFHCIKAEREREARETPGLTWFQVLLYLLVLVTVLLLMAYVVTHFPHHGGGGLTNLTNDMDLGTSRSPWTVVGALAVFLVFYILAHFLEAGKPRCPSCGEVLKDPPGDDYYCLHCRRFWPKDDIDVGVIE